MARDWKLQGLSLRAIAALLASLGYLAPDGKAYRAGSIAAMVR